MLSRLEWAIEPTHNFHFSLKFANDVGGRRPPRVRIHMDENLPCTHLPSTKPNTKLMLRIPLYIFNTMYLYNNPDLSRLISDPQTQAAFCTAQTMYGALEDRYLYIVVYAMNTQQVWLCVVSGCVNFVVISWIMFCFSLSVGLRRCNFATPTRLGRNCYRYQDYMVRNDLDDGLQNNIHCVCGARFDKTHYTMISTRGNF